MYTHIFGMPNVTEFMTPTFVLWIMPMSLHPPDFHLVWVGSCLIRHTMLYLMMTGVATRLKPKIYTPTTFRTTGYSPSWVALIHSLYHTL